MTGLIRLLALDLDGTLLDSQRQCSDRNRRALEAARERGVTIVLASGRMHHSVEEEAVKLDLAGPLISYNGALLCRAGSPEPLFHQTVPADLAASVVQMAVRCRAHLQYFLAGAAAAEVAPEASRAPGGQPVALPEVLLVPRVSHWARLYQRRAGSVPVPVGDLRKLRGREPTKMILIAEPEDIERLLPQCQQEYAGRLYITRSLPEYLEFMHPEVSKGNALRRLADYLGVPLHQTMACGDELNDLPLVEAAGIGVAMPQAAPEVRAAADFVPSSGPEGVAEAIEKYVLA